MKIGHAHVATDEQDTRLQLDELECAGCKRIFKEVASSAKNDRLEPAGLLDSARTGGRVIMWALGHLARLDRKVDGSLARSSRQRRRFAAAALPAKKRLGQACYGFGSAGRRAAAIAGRSFMASVSGEIGPMCLATTAPVPSTTKVSGIP